MRANLLRIIAIVLAVAFGGAAWIDLVAGATPELQSGTGTPSIELTVTPGDRELDAEWELVGISEFLYMSIQWREHSSDVWERYGKDTTRHAFLFILRRTRAISTLILFPCTLKPKKIGEMCH